MANPPPKSLQPFVGKDMRVVQIPVKYSKKLDLANWAIELFENGVVYSEKQVNELLLTCLDDFAFLRRFLIELKFLDRDRYGRAYTRLLEKEKVASK
jgi:hypothetical protein